MTRMLHWISKYSKNYDNVTVTDVTSHYSSLSLIGPASTELLQSLTQTSLDIDDFPVNTIKVDSCLKTKLCFGIIFTMHMAIQANKQKHYTC